MHNIHKNNQSSVHFGKLEVIPATKSHLKDVLANLRFEDVCELEYSTGRSAKAAAARAFALSPKRWAVMQGNKCIALGGAQSYAEYKHVAAVWFFGTPKLNAMRKEVVRIGLYYTKLLHETWPCLVNVLPPWVLQERNGMRRLLQQCGFSISEAKPCGPSGRLLHVFMTKKSMLADKERWRTMQMYKK